MPPRRGQQSFPIWACSHKQRAGISPSDTCPLTLCSIFLLIYEKCEKTAHTLCQIFLYNIPNQLDLIGPQLL